MPNYEPNNVTHLIYERNEHNSLPLMLFSIEICREGAWVEVKNGGIHIDHQTLSRKEEVPHITLRKKLLPL